MMSFISILLVMIGEVISFSPSSSGSSTKYFKMAMGMEKEILVSAFASASTNELFVAPETKSSLERNTRYFGFRKEEYFLDRSAGKRFYGRTTPTGGKYIDFSLEEETSRPLWELSVREIVGQSFFQNPFISSIYERGYRQNFKTAGFPGIEKEFTEIDDFFIQAGAKVVMDLSCGSGFMTRRLIKSGHYDRILCADLSPTMLAETLVNTDREGLPAPEAIRCDASRLPLKDGVLDAIHAGAALHCWPRLEEALAEVYRVLKPGGVFYASTFLVQAYNIVNDRPGPEQNSGFRLFENEEELEGLLTDAGFLAHATIVRKEGRGCAIIMATKT